MNDYIQKLLTYGYTLKFLSNMSWVTEHIRILIYLKVFGFYFYSFIYQEQQKSKEKELFSNLLHFLRSAQSNSILSLENFILIFPIFIPIKTILKREILNANSHFCCENLKIPLYFIYVFPKTYLF